MYLAHAEKFDKALAESWKGDMDAQLIFVCIFFPRIEKLVLGANSDVLLKKGRSFLRRYHGVSHRKLQAASM